MPTTLKTAVLDYLRSGNASPGTRQEYHTTLRKWKQRGRGVPLEKLGHREIREFLDWVYEHAVEEQGTNPGRTANKAREQLRAVAWAWDQELIETPPRFPKRRHPRDVTGRHYLSKAEINALYFASHKLKRPRGWDSPHTVGRYGPLPASLPREEVRHELSPEQRRCPGCGEVRQEIGSETSEQLEFVPASYKVLVHVRVKYACRHCQENVTIAAKPVRPIDKGLPGPGLIAHTVLAKYGDHMPLYRQDDDSTRHGWCSAVARFATGLPLPPIWLSRFTSGCASWCCSHGWCTPTILRRSCSIRRCARPERLVLGLHRRHRTSLHGVRLHHKPRARRPGEVPGRLSRLPASRRLRRLQRHLSGSSGKIVEVACWTHCRRYWWEARTSDSRRAHQALAYIARLYKNERALAGASDEQRCAARQQHALPILNRFGQWLQREQQEVLPKSPIAAAITYTRNQWQAL
jgi:transposase